MSTLAELTTPLTVAEARAVIYQALAVRGVTTTTWKPGAVVRTIIAGLAIVLAALSALQAALARSAFLDFAAGAWLTLVARYVYEVERNGGTFATGAVTLDNPGGGVFAVAEGDLIVASSVTGKTYRNTAAFALAAGQMGVSVPVAANELGSASSAAAGTITEFVTPMLGVACTNPAALVGQDADSDATLRAICRAKWSTLGTGSTAAAYEYWARTSSAEVARVAVRPHDALGVDTDGHVTVVLASSSSGVSPEAVTTVGASISAKRPLCATVHVVSAQAAAFAVNAILTVRTGNGAAAAAAAAANLAALAAAHRIGETVYRAALIEQLMTPAGVVNVVVNAPLGDVPLAFNEVPALAPAFAIVEVP